MSLNVFAKQKDSNWRSYLKNMLYRTDKNNIRLDTLI
jgi:hypothetical protein